MSTKLHNLGAGEHPSIGIESIIDGTNISPKRTHTDNTIVALELTHQGRRHFDFLLSSVLHFGVQMVVKWNQDKTTMVLAPWHLSFRIGDP